MSMRTTDQGSHESGADARCARITGIAKMTLLVGILVVAALFSWAIFQPQTRHSAVPLVVEGLVEAEILPVAAKSRDFPLELQSMADLSSGPWSRDGQLFAQATQPGDWVEWTLPLGVSAEYEVQVYLTRSADYGVVQASINGNPAGGPIDLWASDGVTRPTGPLSLGSHRLEAPKATLRLEVVGRNDKNAPSHYHFGFDGIRALAVR